MGFSFSREMNNLKESEKLRVDPPDNICEVFIALGKVELIHINDQERTGSIAGNPGVIKAIQTLQVIEADIFLIIASSLLYLVN